MSNVREQEKPPQQTPSAVAAAMKLSSMFQRPVQAIPRATLAGQQGERSILACYKN